MDETNRYTFQRPNDFRGGEHGDQPEKDKERKENGFNGDVTQNGGRSGKVKKNPLRCPRKRKHGRERRSET